MNSKKVMVALDHKKAIKISITFLIIGLLVFVWAYVSMSQHIGLDNLNIRVLDLAVENRSSWLIAIAKFITNFANPVSFATITTIVIVSWYIKNTEVWRPMILFSSMVLTSAISFMLKATVMDSRPPKVNMIPAYEIDYSFPSGHTIITIVFLLVIGYLLYSRSYTKTRIVSWILAAILGALIMAASRLYLGYHWLTDVIASIGLGFVILSIVIMVDQKFAPHFKKVK